MRATLPLALLLGATSAVAAQPAARPVEVLLTADVWGEHGPCG